MPTPLSSILGFGGDGPWIVSTTGTTLQPRGKYLSDGGNTSADPDWANVAALLSFDGDLSDATGNVWTSENNFITSAAQARFGSQSGRWAASNSAATTPNASKFNAAGDFCVDYWFFRPGGFATPSNIFGRGAGINTASWITYLAADASIRFYANNTDLVSTGPLPADVWSAVRFNRASGTLSAYLNGARTAQVANTFNYNSAIGLNLGLSGNNNPGTCHIDECRLTVGSSRETGASYTVATAAFPRLGAQLDYPLPAVIAPGDHFLLVCATATARIITGAGRRIGANAVGANVTLTAGQRAWLVARTETQLDIVP